MLFIIYLLSASLITFVLYGYDKALAKSHKRRIPERWLLGAGLAGGALGGLAGMVLFRHKTRHNRFWIILILAALFYIWLLVLNL